MSFIYPRIGQAVCDRCGRRSEPFDSSEEMDIDLVLDGWEEFDGFALCPHCDELGAWPDFPVELCGE